jgi:hypothetical protein
LHFFIGVRCGLGSASCGCRRGSRRFRPPGVSAQKTMDSDCARRRPPRRLGVADSRSHRGGRVMRRRCGNTAAGREDGSTSSLAPPLQPQASSVGVGGMVERRSPEIAGPAAVGGRLFVVAVRRLRRWRRTLTRCMTALKLRRCRGRKPHFARIRQNRSCRGMETAGPLDEARG